MVDLRYLKPTKLKIILTIILFIVLFNLYFLTFRSSYGISPALPGTYTEYHTEASDFIFICLITILFYCFYSLLQGKFEEHKDKPVAPQP